MISLFPSSSFARFLLPVTGVESLHAPDSRSRSIPVVGPPEISSWTLHSLSCLVHSPGCDGNHDRQSGTQAVRQLLGNSEPAVRSQPTSKSRPFFG